MLCGDGIDEKRPSILQVGDHHHAEDGKGEDRPSRPLQYDRPPVELSCDCHLFSPTARPRLFFQFRDLVSQGCDLWSQAGPWYIIFQDSSRNCCCAAATSLSSSNENGRVWGNSHAAHRCQAVPWRKRKRPA